MSEFSSDIAFTSAVKAIQKRKGSRASYSHMEKSGGWQTMVTPELAEFLAELAKQRVKLSKKDEFELLELFEEERATLNALKKSLDKTDQEIDHLVYPNSCNRGLNICKNENYKKCFNNIHNKSGNYD